MSVMQLESLAEVLHTAADQDTAARAAVADLEQRRQQLVNDNMACENAIGDVCQRKEVRLLFFTVLSYCYCCCICCQHGVCVDATAASVCSCDLP